MASSTIHQDYNNNNNMNKDYDDRLCRKTRKSLCSLDDEADRMQMRQAAKSAVAQAFSASFTLAAATANSSNNNNKSLMTVPPSMVASANDNDNDDLFTMTTSSQQNHNNNNNNNNSDGSIIERAVRRGSQRGSGEFSDVLYQDAEIDDDDVDAYRRDDGTEFDLTTVTDDLRTNPSAATAASTDNKKSKRKFLPLKWFQRKRLKMRPHSAARRRHVVLLPRRPRAIKHQRPDSILLHARDVGKYEAWMCGVCGKAFSSLEAAERHEEYHIREVVADLGWAGEKEEEKDDDGIVTPSVASMATYERDNRFLPHATNNNKVMVVGNNNNNKTFRKKENPAGISKVTFVETSDSNKAHRPARHLDSFTDLPEDALIPSPLLFGNKKPRPPPPRKSNWNKFQNDYDDKLSFDDDDNLLLPDYMRHSIMLADEALVDVCQRAEYLILTRQEVEAERELHLLANDKSYYDQIAERTTARTANPTNRFRSEGKTLLSKVQNKLIDTYQLMKEGDMKGVGGPDHYERKGKGGHNQQPIVHTNKTIFVNVIVKNSIQVVRHELERLAKQRWEDAQFEAGDHFNRFRAIAHGNLVKLAGLALASDFTPRKIAVQLSNDLYWLLTPRLRRRGVTIETEIEYRNGPYFVLAVNVKTIDWLKLIKFTNKEVAERNSRWKEQQKRRTEVKEHVEGAAPRNDGVLRCVAKLVYQSTQLTVDEVLAQLLAWLYYIHWVFYYPLLVVTYKLFLGPIVRKFIISSVADEIFNFVEEKGMEMEISVREAANQAAFMLSAIRELRADGRELKKKRQETQSSQKGSILGPLLGPAIKADKGAAEKPPGFEVPDNLEFVGLELDLPVGFRRLRWAMLSSKSQFLIEGVLRTEAKYDKISTKPWSKHDESIGLPNLPNGVSETDFIGAERETSYLMPKTVFVGANMCYETKHLIAYNDYCFCVKSKTLTPEVPYGSTFIAWTQHLIINTGNNTCKMICSVEAEFPNGPPLVSRQIKSGMRAGTAQAFVLLGETVSKYADDYP